MIKNYQIKDILQKVLFNRFFLNTIAENSQNVRLHVLAISNTPAWYN